MARETVIEALVLRRWAVGEADKRLCLYTRERGKVYALARGSRRAGSKMGSLSEPLALIRARLIQGRSSSLLAQPQPIHTFPHLHFDLERLSFALAFCELLDRLVPEGEPNESLFLLACQTLQQLEEHSEPRTLLAWAVWRVIGLLGYQPSLHACVRCGKPPEGKVVGLDAAHGGLVCARCLSQAPQAFRLPGEALNELSRWINSANVPPTAVHSTVLLNAGRSYLQFFLEGELKAFDFLNLLGTHLAVE